MNWLTDLLKVSSKPKPKNLKEGKYNMSVVSMDSEDGKESKSKVRGKFTGKVINEGKNNK